MTRPLAALTGGSGFLGGHVAQALHAAGWRLRVLSRSDAAPAGLDTLEPEVVAGRLGDPQALERLVEGAQAVIHAAGLIKARRLQDFEDINVRGAKDIAAAAAARAPNAHFVLVSSLSAREARLSPYAASKAGGEAAVRTMVPPELLTIVRPPAIYGPGDRETLALFQLAAASPILPLMGSPQARLALIHVEDAAAQIAALASRPADGAVYALADSRPEGYAWRELGAAAARAVGRPPPALIAVPPALTLAAAATNSLLGRLGGEPSILSIGKAREMLHPDWSVYPQELARDLPTIRFGIDEGFADVVRWYRARGWLKGQPAPTASPEG